MKKSLFNLITVAFAAVCALSLASCDFFLHGEELKKELDQQIAYTNAPSVSVYLKADAELGEFLSDGEKSFKVGYDTEVQFTVNQESYVFEKLEAVVRNSPETSRSESVQFTEVESDAKKGIYKINVKVLEQVSDIMIRPVCTLLPKISSISPALETNGCNQDSAITIVFNKNMNPESFKNSNGKITGLSITNGDDEDLSAYFDEPYFASDNKTLVILPLCYADNPKFLLPPDESKSSLNIKVNYTFVDVKDEDGLSFTENGTHNYKINKNFNKQEEVTVIVQNPDSSYGSFLSAGEKSCIVGFGFEIEFTLNTESYIFECFEAVSKNDGESRADCVAYENTQYDKETGVCRAKVRVLQAASDILIRPKCTLIENAEVTITQSEKGTKTISPADGTKVQSFLDRWYSVSFSPDEEYYEFIRWELYDINTDEEIPNGTYVKLDDPTQPSTNYKVTQVPDTGIELALRPVVAERPQIISNTPQNSGILKDSSIQVLFDRDMDENSIYYSDDERKSLIAKVGEENLLSSDKREGKYYGYIKDGLTYYKNISLTNKKTGENLNDKFEAPVFEDKSTLTIPASKEKGKIIDDYTQVLVTLEKDFFYSEKIDETTSKPVTLRGITKWSYQVTNHGDEDALVFQKKNGNDVFTLKLNEEAQQSLAVGTAHPVIGEDGTGIKDLIFIKSIDEKPTLYCNMALQDVAGGTGPNSTFTVWYERIKIGGSGTGLTGSFTSEYKNTTSEDAIFEDDFDLKLPSGGTYRIWFDFTDRSNNHFIYPTNADKDGSTGFYVTTTDFNISITGTPKMTAFLVGEDFDGSGLKMTVSLTNSYSWTEDINQYHDFKSSEECFTGKSVTVSYTIAGVTKTANINETYYVAAANALTQKPVKLTETEYEGTLSGGTYYKFGDFPQTIASSQDDDDYTSDTVRNGWYLNKTDGHFYAKCAENANNFNTYYSDNTSVARWGRSRYFKVEPIVWRALTADFDHDSDGTGDKILLLAERFLTTNSYYDYINVNRTIDGNTVYPNNYEHSKIRAYLNGLSYAVKESDSAEQTTDSTYNGIGFLQTAFTSSAQSLIATTTVDNSAASTNPASNASEFNSGTNDYACGNTSDKIFLLSEKEATTSDYGFTEYNVNGTENSRIRETTDYAKAEGAKIDYSDRSPWWLRSPNYEYNTHAREIYYKGKATSSSYVLATTSGVVPALCISAQ